MLDLSNPRHEYASSLPGARVIVPEAELGTIGLLNVAFDTVAQRNAAAEAMEHAGLWTGLVLYLDTQGPAIQAVRNPEIGPIRSWCGVQR